MGTWSFIPGEGKRPGREVERRHVVPTLRMSETIPLFPPETSWRGQGKLNDLFFLAFCQILEFFDKRHVFMLLDI